MTIFQSKYKIYQGDLNEFYGYPGNENNRISEQLISQFKPDEDTDFIVSEAERLLGTDNNIHIFNLIYLIEEFYKRKIIVDSKVIKNITNNIIKNLNPSKTSAYQEYLDAIYSLNSFNQGYFEKIFDEIKDNDVIRKDTWLVLAWIFEGLSNEKYFLESYKRYFNMWFFHFDHFKQFKYFLKIDIGLKTSFLEELLQKIPDTRWEWLITNFFLISRENTKLFLESFENQEDLLY